MSLVLIVEDEPVLRASMARGLAKVPGLEVVDAGTMAEAEKLLGAMRPKLLVSDLDLPDGTGIQLLAAMERLNLRIPTIFISAYVQRFQAQLRRHPGVEVREKPLPLATLRELVATYLGTSEAGGASAPPPFTLVDYLQLAAMGRRSVHIELRRDGLRVGEVVVRGGEAWHAEDIEGRGVDAFRRLVAQHDVTIACHGIAAVPPLRTLEGPCEALLLDALRRIDEAHQTTPALAAAATPADSYEACFDQGLEALIDKRYHVAYEAFSAAAQRRSTPAVEANLARLRALGFGPKQSTSG
jgi:CheY-like chemotaxis protein